MPPRTDALQGTLTLLILKTLDAGPRHGYAIAQHIQHTSNALLRVEEGSLYPALRRLEQEGWVKSSWSVTESQRKARVYALTAHRSATAGRRRSEMAEASPGRPPCPAVRGVAAMSWMRRLLNSGPRQADIERELADEVAFHREQQVADLEADGWAPDEAPP